MRSFHGRLFDLNQVNQEEEEEKEEEEDESVSKESFNRV